MSGAITKGVNHVALTVKDLDQTTAFFTQTLGFEKAGEDPGYPAAFVTDGTTLIALWRAKQPDLAKPFDRFNVLGLHHVAFTVDDDRLDELHARLAAHPECKVEFEPEPMYGGPSRHMMCTIPGSGVRVEFTAPKS